MEAGRSITHAYLRSSPYFVKTPTDVRKNVANRFSAAFKEGRLSFCTRGRAKLEKSEIPNGIKHCVRRDDLVIRADVFTQSETGRNCS